MNRTLNSAAADVEPSACFTYGSLMWPEIMARVCGRDPVAGFEPGRMGGLTRSAAGLREAAWLDGHTRHPVMGQDYPGLVVREGAPALRGVLYRGITPAEWGRLDAFEGPEYERVRVMVRTGGPQGPSEPAWVYRFRAVFAHRLGPGDWSEAAFEAEGKARFCARYVGFGHVDGPT